MTLGRTRAPRSRNRDRQRDMDREQDGFTENVVNIRRVAKTVAGGRRFTFNALVVVGDGKGQVGIGLGKASEVPDAVQKGSAMARRALNSVSLLESTVPQQVVSRFGGAQVMLKPAAPGTGVRASAAVRAVVQAAGVRDILTKSQGSNNPINVVRATLRGLQMMRDPHDRINLRRAVRGEPPLERVTETETSSAEAETATAAVVATPPAEEAPQKEPAAAAEEAQPETTAPAEEPTASVEAATAEASGPDEAPEASATEGEPSSEPEASVEAPEATADKVDAKSDGDDGEQSP